MLIVNEHGVSLNLNPFQNLKERGKSMASVEVNKIAPDFKLLDLNGEPFQLSSFKGSKNVLLVMNRGFV